MDLYCNHFIIPVVVLCHNILCIQKIKISIETEGFKR